MIDHANKSTNTAIGGMTLSLIPKILSKKIDWIFKAKD